jgi:hypothetical protein
MRLKKKFGINDARVSLFLKFGLVLTVIFLSYFVVGFIQLNFLKSSSSILILSERFSKRFAGLLALLAFLLGYVICVNMRDLLAILKGKKTRIQNVLRFKIGISVIFVIVLILIYTSICFANNYIEIFNNGITSHNGFLMKTIVYSYSRVRGVKIGYITGRYGSTPEYALVMDDGEKLNIASDGVRPYLLFSIDSILPNSVKRECSSEGKSHIIDKMPQKYQEYFYGKYLR